MNDPKQICIHKSGYNFEGVDDIRKYHMSKGWIDCGYHYVIQRDGTLQEGRPIDVEPASAKGHNIDVAAICLIGEFCKEEPTDAQINTLTALVFTLCKKHDIPTDMHHIFCHSDYRDKPGNRWCPGKFLHRRVPQIANNVRNALRNGVNIS